MRKLLLLLLLATTGLAAQSDRYDDLSDRLAAYARSAMAWDVEAMLDLTDPDLFEIVPREMMAEQLAALRSSAALRVEVRNFAIGKIGEELVSGGTAYAPVECRHELVFEIRQPAEVSSDKVVRLRRMLEKRYGKVRVRRAGQAGFVVRMDKFLYAIRRPGRNWHFVEYQPEAPAVLDLLLPPGVRERGF